MESFILVLLYINIVLNNLILILFILLLKFKLSTKKYFNGRITMNKKILLISISIFMIVLSIGAASAVDADDAIASSDDDVALEDSGPISGSVSGGVDVVTENPWNTAGELSYDIPSDAKTIKSADVYVNVYSGSAANTYGANANITITTANGETKYNETLWKNEGSTDGVVYPVNDHTTKCYSDYMIHYNITSLLDGLNGTSLKINVDTFKMEDKSFDGRIKLIGLILAYDDGDDDKIDYLIDDNQRWSDKEFNITFDTSSLNEVFKLSLTNIALSNSDATYIINGNFTEAKKHASGNYYQFNQWDITPYFIQGQDTTLLVKPGQGYSGPSYKSALSVITSLSGDYSASASVKVSDNTKDIVYPGFANTLTVTVDSKKSGKYVIKLLADGSVVNSTEVDLVSGVSTVTIVDPTIREINASAKYTGDASSVYDTVNYQVQVLFDDVLLNESSSYETTVLYNGYLGKDTYNDVSLVPFYIGEVSDIVILTNGTYASGTGKYALVNYDVALPANSSIVKAYLYVTYTYGGINDNINMFNVTLNNNRASPVFFARDASNLKYNSGSGVVVYDVTDLIANGTNVLDLNKTGSAGVYPTTLIYMYNTTGSKIVKEVYIANGADLLGSYGGFTNPIYVNSTIDVDSTHVKNAVAYVFANGAADGRGTVVINGVSEDHPWNGNSQSTDLYTADITSTIKDTNSISVVYNNGVDGSFTALQQIIVLTKDAQRVDASIKVSDNTKDIVYPGFTNVFTVTVNPNKGGRYVINLLADGSVVNTTEMDLDSGVNTVTIVDPTIREINASAKYTGNASSVYDTVNYQVQVLFNDELLNESSYVATVLYNGYLGKDTYNDVSFEPFYAGVVTDIVILTNGTYATGTNKYDLVNYDVALPANSDFVKAFLYVTYTYGGINDNINMFNVTLNNNRASPVFFARDASNLKYNSGSGVVVYDVTDLIANGTNVLDLNKTGSAGVYPTTLIYMYNTTGSKIVKEVYIANGADLLGSYGGFTNPIYVNSTIDVDSTHVKNAVAYVFANGAADGRGTVVINGVSEDHPWNGNSQSTDLYATDITSTIKDNNTISVVYNNGVTGSFTALQQIIVLTKDMRETPKMETNVSINQFGQIEVEVAINKDANGNITFVIQNQTGNVIANITVPVDNGSASFSELFTVDKGSYTVTTSYSGDDNYVPSEKQDAIESTKTFLTITETVNVAANQVTIDFNLGNATGNVTVFFLSYGTNATYNITNGKVLVDEIFDNGDQSVLLTYDGDDSYYGVYEHYVDFFVKASSFITVKPVSVVYNKDAKVTVTLTDNNDRKGNNPISNAEVVITVGGKTFKGKTNDKGIATITIPATFVPKAYDAKVTYAGTDACIGDTENFKLTVKKATVKLTAKKKTFKAKVKTKKYTVTLKDNKGKVMKKVKLSLKVKGKTVKATTNKKGKATFKIKNLKKKGTYKAKITFKGNKYFNKLTKKATIKIKK